MNLEKTLTILSITLFSFSLNANAAEVPADVKACNAAVNNGDGAAAVTLAEGILKKNAKDHEGLICKARALGAQKKYEESTQVYQQAIDASKPGFEQVITYILLGNLHNENNKTAEAIASYKESLKACDATQNQTYARINHQLIGDTHVRAKDLNAALDSYLVGVRLSNNDNERAESFGKAAAVYNALGQYDKAVEYQVKTTVMQKKAGALTDYADASLLLGQYHYNAGDHSNSERVYKHLAQFAKDNGGAYYEAKANQGLAEALAANGDKETAKTLLSQALKQANAIGAKQLASEISASKKKLNI